MAPRASLILCLALAALPAAAQQYRWVDEKGRVHYTDTPPPASAKGTQKKDLRGNTVGAQENFELSQAMRTSPVTLYSAPECGELCQMARDVLNQRGIPFSEVSVTDEAKINQLKQVSGGMRVPVMVVGAQVETNVTADAYNRALDLAGYPRAGVVAARKQAAPPAPAPTQAAQPQGAAQPAQSSGMPPLPPVAPAAEPAEESR